MSRASASSCKRIDKLYVPRMSILLCPPELSVPKTMTFGPLSSTVILQSWSLHSLGYGVQKKKKYLCPLAREFASTSDRRR